MDADDLDPADQKTRFAGNAGALARNEREARTTTWIKVLTRLEETSRVGRSGRGRPRSQ